MRDSSPGNQRNEISLSPDYLPYSDEDFGDRLGAEPARTSRQRAIRNTLLVQLQEAVAQGAGVHFSKRPQHYADKRPYYGDRLGYNGVIKAVETLRDVGIISEKTAPSGPNVKHRSQAKLRPEYAGAIPVNTPASTIVIAEPIRLKNKAKIFTSYDDTQQTRSMRRDVIAQNEAIRSVEIGCENTGWVRDERGLIHKGGQVLNPAHNQLYRVFNRNSFLSLGRFYGAFWQNMPSEDRKLITINDDPTVEHDYSSLHPNLLAAMVGVDLRNADAYEIDIDILGIKRRHIKPAFNILINASSERRARGAIARKLCENGPCIEFHDALMVAGRIIQQIKERHPKFEKLWCKGIGLRLQNIDSKMCAEVQAGMRARGEVALSNHDSFIVRQTAQSTLQDAMEIALQKAVSGLQNTNETPLW